MTWWEAALSACVLAPQMCSSPGDPAPPLAGATGALGSCWDLRMVPATLNAAKQVASSPRVDVRGLGSIRNWH